MPIRIGDSFMRLEIDGKVVATAAERAWLRCAALTPERPAHRLGRLG